MSDGNQREKLRDLLSALIDQRAARVIIPPYENAPGFWFGGGNIVKDAQGTLWLVGRYRNSGDSTKGLGSGERGLELALFASKNNGETFEKVTSWSKQDFRHDEAEVISIISIEGAALYLAPQGGCELLVSTEKRLEYPENVRKYQKPGTGIWSIDRIKSSSIETLDPITIEPIFTRTPPLQYLHVKDPVVFSREKGETVLIFCSHPFSWTSSNSGYVVRPSNADNFALVSWEMTHRGTVWDVAGTRITGRMPVPRVGCFADQPPCSVYFYDGLECVRPLDQHPQAVARPRGYSCEELGGAFIGQDDAFPEMERLSLLEPLFVSPYGTGCSRYVDTFVDSDGILATWQQAQEDGSQPLVANKLDMDEITRILS